MTTVGLTIERVGGPERLYLSNGLSGPATTALHALVDAFRSGTLTGNWHSTYIKTTASGRVIRSVLTAIDEYDPEFRDEPDRLRFTAFRDAVEDEAQYAVTAIEV